MLGVQEDQLTVVRLDEDLDAWIQVGAPPCVFYYLAYPTDGGWLVYVDIDHEGLGLERGDMLFSSRDVVDNADLNVSSEALLEFFHKCVSLYVSG